MSEHHTHQELGDGHECSAEPSALLVELREHLPFSVSAVAIGMIVAGSLCILALEVPVPAGDIGAAALQVDAHDGIHDHAPGDGHDYGQHDGHDHGPQAAGLFFHLFHAAHMLFSGAATAAMFCRYERRYIKAMIIGLIGATGVCGISDIIMPHFSLQVLGTYTPLHICVIEHPGMVLPFAGVGVLVGAAAAGSVRRATIISHSMHVFTSTMASIFYMVGALGLVAWIGPQLGRILVFIVLAVMIPCCLSDIVFPMFMSKAGRAKYEGEPHMH